MHKSWRRIGLVIVRALALGALLPAFALVAQEPYNGGIRNLEPLPKLEQPVFRVENVRLTPEQQALLDKYPNHPLAPLLKWAYSGVNDVAAIKDYTCTLVKRTRIGGVLGQTQFLSCKIRHQPFSVYLHFNKPDDLKGQEALFVRGKYDNKLIAHSPPHTFTYKTVGTVHIDPNGIIAMQGQRYPITSTGVLFLLQEMIRNGEHDIAYGECEVQQQTGAKINGRSCMLVQVVHPKPRKDFQFHIARIYIDDEYGFPTRYEAWTWPDEPGGQPKLLEEYTYLDVKLNQNLTEADFDWENPAYRFKK